jgi:hypothetical protein
VKETRAKVEVPQRKKSVKAVVEKPVIEKRERSLRVRNVEVKKEK